MALVIDHQIYKYNTNTFKFNITNFNVAEIILFLNRSTMSEGNGGVLMRECARTRI